MFIKTVIRKFMLPRDGLDTDLSDHKGTQEFDKIVNEAVRNLKAPNRQGTFVKETYVQSHVDQGFVTLVATIIYSKRDQVV